MSYLTIDYLAGDADAATAAATTARDRLFRRRADTAAGVPGASDLSSPYDIAEAALAGALAAVSTPPEGLLAPRVASGDLAATAGTVAATWSLGPGSRVGDVSDMQWRLLALALVRVLSRRRMPALIEAFEDKAGRAKVKELLQGLDHTMHHLQSLEDLLMGNDD